MKPDSQLKHDVETELEWDPAVDASHVGVEVKNGVVTLSGHLDSFPEKIAAERAAERVAGVRGIAVELDVRLPGSSRRTDTDIARIAAEALHWNAWVPRDAVKVWAEDGRITLSGELDWDYQRAAAESAVRSLMGVKSVSNQVRIRRTTSAGDVKAVLELVGEANDTESVEEFRAFLLPALCRIVPAEFASYNEVVDGGRVLAAIVQPELPAEILRAGGEHASQNPLVARYARTRDARPYRFSDVVSEAELHDAVVQQKEA